MREDSKSYWCIKVPEHICKSCEIYLHSDTAEIIEGNLIFKRNDQVVFSLSQGNWNVFYLASVIDGHAFYVEHWDGEVIRK